MQTELPEHTLIPDDNSSTTYGNSEDWTVVPDVQYTDFLVDGGESNEPPTANDDNYSTEEGQTLTVPTPGVLANDTDPDGDSLTAVLDTSVANGSLTFNANGSFAYTPDSGFVGTDDFLYEAVDDSGATDDAAVSLTVEPAANPPTAQPDSFRTAEGRTLTVPPPGVLANDTDPEGDSLSAELVSTPSSGLILFDDNGSFEYGPEPGFTGTDQFTYRAVDPNGNADTTSITIQVQSPGAGPSPGPPLAAVADYEDEDRNFVATGSTALQLDSSVVSPASNGLTSLRIDATTDGAARLERPAHLPESDRLRFLLKPNSDTSFTLTLTFEESDGVGNIDSFETSVPVDSGDTWQRIEIPFSDLGPGFDPIAPRAGGNGGFLQLDLATDVDVTFHVDEFTFGTESRALVELMDFERTALAYGNPFCPPTLTDTSDVAVGSDGFTARSVAGSGCFGYNYGTGTSRPGLFVDADGNDVLSFRVKAEEGGSLSAFIETSFGAGGFTLENETTVPLPSDDSWSRIEIPLDSLGDDPSALRSPGIWNIGFEGFGPEGTEAAFLIDDVKIRAAGPNNPPVARPDTFSTSPGQPLTVDAPGVLGNDSDPNQDPLAASLLSDVSQGSLTLENDGAFEYVPNDGFTGTDQFTYAASDGSAADTATVSLQVTDGLLTRILPLDAGWNLISVPLQVEDSNFGAVVGEFCESGFTFNPQSGYSLIEDTDPLFTGEGFWANCSSGTLEVVGITPDTQSVAVDPGWNIVGPFSDSVDVASITSDPAGIVQSNFFGFGDGPGYQEVSVLTPGQGVWVKIGAEGTLDFSGAGSNPALASSTLATPQSPKQGTDASGATLQLTDAEGRTATLHLASELTETQRHQSDLPPVPPSGVFDVRFEDGHSVAEVQEEGALHAIETQGLRVPVTVELAGAEAGRSIQLRHGSGETRLTAERPSAELSLTDDLAVGLQGAPDAFALNKTYPNPASGRTTVEYALPTQADVTIAVYDVLGRRVATLADGSEQAGRHRAELDARRMPSGTYFVRMRAESFQETRRLTIVK